VTVLDVVPAAAEDLVTEGATAGTSPRQVASDTDVLVTMLPDSPEVQQVYLGPDGAFEALRPGWLAIDMSSIAPAVARDLAARAAAAGADAIDAPVSGGDKGAIAGTLSIMVGGSEAAFERARPILEVMGKTIVHAGGSGNGQAAKICNNMVLGISMIAVSEAFVLATKAGVNPEAVFNAIKGGLAGSTVMNAKVPMILDGNFKPGFRIELHIKDLQNALDTAHVLNVPVPLTANVMETLQGLKNDDFGANDHSAIVRHYEKLAKVEVRR
jgi:2-hydroxy-3-oxopropionate reductase